MRVSLKMRRHVIQLLFLALLIPPVYFLDVYWFGTYISADLAGVALTDPLTALEITLAGRTLWWPLWVSALPLILVAVLLGRVFCSYVCPLNLLLEVLPVRRRRQLQQKTWPIVALVVVLAVSLVLAVPVNNTYSPVYALMRGTLFGLGLELVLVLLVLLAALRWGRKIWCRTLCPLGALYGLLGLKRRLAVRVDATRCTHCNACARACSMGTAPGRTELAESYLCTNCGDCIDACKEGALHFTFKGGDCDETK